MIILLGESSSGKSTIEKELVKNYGLKNIVSYTTRQPRDGEINGVDYNFVDKSEFRRLNLQSFFVETAEYNGWMYGTPKNQCGDDKVLVATPHGLRQMKKVDGLNIVSFYINVPRRDRLIKILQRGDSIDEACRRSLSDVGMYDGVSDEVDFVVCNDGYEKSPEQLTFEILRLVNLM